MAMMGMGNELIFQRITDRVIYCIIRVHQALGPGFVESVYKRAMVVELSLQGVAFEVEKEVAIHYNGQLVGSHRMDLVVEGCLIVELKTVETLSKAHYAQTRSYLKATGFELALLVNFSSDRADFRRVTPGW